MIWHIHIHVLSWKAKISVSSKVVFTGTMRTCLAAWKFWSKLEKAMQRCYPLPVYVLAANSVTAWSSINGVCVPDRTWEMWTVHSLLKEADKPVQLPCIVAYLQISYFKCLGCPNLTHRRSWDPYMIWYLNIQFNSSIESDSLYFATNTKIFLLLDVFL